MKKIRTLPVSMFKYISIILLLLVAAVITINLVTHSQKRGQTIISTTKDLTQKSAQKDGIRHNEYNEGKKVIDVISESGRMGEDGQQHLINAQVKFFRSGIVIISEEIVHDKEYKHFQSLGRSEIHYKDLILKATFLEYDVEMDLLQTDKGIEFASSRIKGSAQELTARVYDESFVMEGNVSLIFSIEGEEDLPLEVVARRLDYSHKWGNGTLDQEVSIIRGESRISADEVRFLLDDERKFISSLNFAGGVAASLVLSAETDDYGIDNPLISPARKREVWADEILLTLHDRSFSLKKFEAKGNGRAVMHAFSGGMTEISAERMTSFFETGGEVINFRAAGGVIMTENREEYSTPTTILSDSMLLRGKNKVLEIKCEQGKTASLAWGVFRVEAREISHYLENGNIVAKNNVSVELFPGQPDTGRLAFFSEEQSVYILAGEMRYQSDSERFIFRDSLKLWQGNQSLKTSEMVLFKSDGKLICKDKVEVLFTLQPKGSESPEKASIKAGKMNFFPDKFQIVYGNGGVLEINKVKLSGDTLSLFMDEKSGELSHITAQGNVRITRESYEGRGGEAVYTLKDDAVVLQDKPVLIDKARGETRGDKLTFYLTDGRIIIENTGRKRSKTIIKS